MARQGGAPEPRGSRSPGNLVPIRPTRTDRPGQHARADPIPRRTGPRTSGLNARCGLYSPSRGQDRPSDRPAQGIPRRRRSAGAVQRARQVLVRGDLQQPDEGPGRWLGSHRRRPSHAHPRAHWERQDPGGVPVVSRPAGDDPAGRGLRARPPERDGPGPVRLAAQGPDLRHRAEPAGAARRHRHRGRAARRGGPEHLDRDPDRRHHERGAPGHRPPPAGHPRHDARVALPHADERCPRGPPRCRARHRRRGPRDRGRQARRAPRAEPRTPRTPDGRPAPADRALGDAATARHDRPVPRRDRARSEGDDRRCRDAQAARAAGDRPGRGHEPDRRDPAARRAARRSGHEPRGPDQHLAVDPSADPRAHPGAPEHDRLRQQPTSRRAARAAPQRARRRGSRAGPPREHRARATPRHRGGSQGRPAAGPGRHEQSRARDRHGRGRPRDPGGIAELGGERTAAGRAGRPPGRRAVARRLLPEVPGRPARDRGRGGADACRVDRDDDAPAQSARRPRPAARRDGRPGPLDGRPARHDRPPGGAVRDAHPGGARRRSGHARRRLSVGRVRRAQAEAHLGSGDRGDRRAARCPGRGHHVGRHDPGSGPVRRVHGRRGRDARTAGRRARRGDGLRGPGR